VHVEAGLRCGNRRMAEERNRIVSDHLADMLCAPTPTAVANLTAEGLAARTVLTGDVLCDALRLYWPRVAERPRTVARDLQDGGYVVATIHRAETTDQPGRLGAVLEALDAIARSVAPVVVPLHPRTRDRIGALHPAWRPERAVHCIEPLDHGDFLRLVRDASVVLTDSGGVQREVYWLGCPCATVREATEWPETLGADHRLLGAVPVAIVEAVRDLGRARAARGRGWSAARADAFGGGVAAERILAAVRTLVEERT